MLSSLLCGSLSTLALVFTPFKYVLLHSDMLHCEGVAL